MLTKLKVYYVSLGWLNTRTSALVNPQHNGDCAAGKHGNNSSMHHQVSRVPIAVRAVCAVTSFVMSKPTMKYASGPALTMAVQ